jgi:hypothetical protein
LSTTASEYPCLCGYPAMSAQDLEDHIVAGQDSDPEQHHGYGRERMDTAIQVLGWVIIAVAFGYLPFGIRRLRRAHRNQVR